MLTDPAGVAEIAGRAAVPVLVHPAPRGVLGGLAATVYGHPSERLTVIGITGTSGKTTTTYLVEAGLRAAGRVAGLIGTIGIRVGGADLPSALTTPEAPTLQAMLAAMVERGVDTVVMEVSSHALALGRVDGTRFAVGAFTNLSRDHLDFHPSMADYFEAKASLFDPDSALRARTAVVCIDDDAGRAMAARAADAITVIRQIRPDLPRRRPAGLRRHPRPSGNSEIGRHALVGIPAAPVQLAVRDGVRGALVKDVRLPQALMPEVVLNCDRDDPGQRGHNVEAIQQALARFAAPADQALLPTFRAFDLPRVRRIDRPR